MRLERFVLWVAAVALSLAGCSETTPTPLNGATAALPTVVTAVASSSAPKAAATKPSPQFAHTACAKGVNLTGQTINFYHLISFANQPDVIANPVLAGFDDATAYFNARGGICGATLVQLHTDPNKVYDAQGEYTRLATLNPKPVMIALYSSDDAELLRDRLAKDQIPALGIRAGSVLGLYGDNGQTPGWIFSTSPLYTDQLGAFCQYVAQHPKQYSKPVIGYLGLEFTGDRAAYTPEAIAYCASLGVKILDNPRYFAVDASDIHALVQYLVDAGANILYTNSSGPGPVLIAKTLVEMKLQSTVPLAAVNWGLDASVGLSGQATLRADGLPSTDGLIGSLPLRTWAEADQIGIQLIAEQADLHQRPLSLRTNFYILGWASTDLYIELYIQTGNRVGFDHITGADIKKTLETIVYSPLGGIETIDFKGGTLRSLSADRIGQMAYLGRDGKTPAGPNNPPLLVNESGQRFFVPLLVPLSNFQPAPDLRPGGADVPTATMSTTVLATSTLAPVATSSPTAAPTTATPAATAIRSTQDVLTGRIAFQTNRDGNDEIYVMNADGSGLVNLTNNSAADGAPAWSPDGKKIGFESYRDGNREIYVMNADGSSVIRLTTNPAQDLQIAWSPDGTKIAFSSDRDGSPEIYVMSAEGGLPVRLTNNPAIDELPSWSPDGKKIAFTTDRDGKIEIYTMNADGSDPTRLTNNPGDNGFPKWSPDGKHILFVSNRDGNSEVYVMNADGSSQTDLTNNPAHDDSPSWSPDGTKIAFYSDREGGSGIYVMNADGGGQTRIIDNFASDPSVAWQP